MSPPLAIVSEPEPALIPIPRDSAFAEASVFAEESSSAGVSGFSCPPAGGSCPSLPPPPEQGCRERADQPPQSILHHGAGWGALALLRRAVDTGAVPVPPAFSFPTDDLGKEQMKWLSLLGQGALPEQDPAELPGEWMVQPEWERLPEASVNTEAGQNWYALLHLGVMRLERLDSAGAAAAWEASLRLKPSAWAARNLAVLSLRQGSPEKALTYYNQAWSLAVQSGDPPIFKPRLGVDR